MHISEKSKIRKYTDDDGTIKLLKILSDNYSIETAILNLEYRIPNKVFCVSSQAGCKFKCNFCRNGHRSFYRNLSTKEIVEQVFDALSIYGLNNGDKFDVTYMGIGEPFDNFNNVFNSIIYLINSYPNINKINISTIAPHGFLSNIHRLYPIDKIHLQYSLHSPFEIERQKLFRFKLPSIKKILTMLDRFSVKKGDRFAINYLLFENLNDSLAHAREIVTLMKNKNGYLKISEYSKIEDSQLLPSSDIKKREFINYLVSNNIRVKSFSSMGQTISAGCGQLVSSITL